MSCVCGAGTCRLLGAVSLEDSGDFIIVLCLRDILVESVRSILMVGKALCWALQEEEKRRGFLTRGPSGGLPGPPATMPQPPVRPDGSACCFDGLFSHSTAHMDPSAPCENAHADPVGRAGPGVLCRRAPVVPAVHRLWFMWCAVDSTSICASLRQDAALWNGLTAYPLLAAAPA